MNTVVSLKNLLVISLLSVSAISVNAYAVPKPAATPAWTKITPTTSPITIDYIQAGALKQASVSYSPLASVILSYDDNPTPQDPTSIKQLFVTEFTAFNLPAPTLTFVSSCDNPTSACTGATGGTTTGTYSNTFSSLSAFNYLAVHFGQGELLFKFATAQTSFSIGGLPRGLSNYRAYTDISAVPEPESYAMLLAGLGLLGFAARKRK